MVVVQGKGVWPWPPNVITRKGAQGMTMADQALSDTDADESATNIRDESNPFEMLQSTALGYSLSRCLHAVADLGVADQLGVEPQSAADLAAAVGAHPDALSRVLRLLAAHGIFEMQGETVRHSPASQLLRTDHPQSMRAFVRLFGLPVMWTVYETFEQSVRTGAPATAQVLPDGLFPYFARRPDEAALFDVAMAAKAQGHVAGILATYDFSRVRRIGDIGGGRGHLLSAVLRAYPSSSGVLFDLPHVIEHVAGLVSDRLTLQAGDFFQDALPTCDTYLLMEVIHDWDDDEAVAILRAIRRAAPEGATLLVIEQMIPDASGPAWTKLLDIHMLALLGGRQRTRQEYAVLLEMAGFALQREVNIPGDLSILEARAT
jgi:O-methyltransferase